MTTEQNGISRRSFLTTASGLAVGVGLAQLPRVAQAADALPALPWPYPTNGLNRDAVAKAAYALYYSEGGCGHGSAQAIIDAIGDALEDQGLLPAENPWKLLPRYLYSYGSGGVVGWGTICGALNGSIAVMGLLKLHGTLGNALVDYFCNTELPTNLLVNWDPQSDGWPVTVKDPLSSCTPSVSRSPLCHNTVSNWAATAGVPLFGPSAAPKSDHCAKLVADIVGKAVDLMNARFIGKTDPGAWTAPASYATCYTCHTKPDMIPSQQGKMECQACHTVPGGHGSWKRNRGPTR